MASRDKYSGTGGRGQPLSRFRFASRSTTLTIGEVAAASGSAATLKRGATGKPFCTFAFIASGEVIQAIASKASSIRSFGRFEGMQSRKPPIGLLEAPRGPRACGRYRTLRFTAELTSLSNRAARTVQQ